MKIIRINPNLKILTLCTVLFALCSTLLPRALAQTPSPEPVEEEDEISPEIKEKVQERIEAIKETGSRKAAYYGTLTDISNSTLTIESEKGERKIQTDEETELIGENSQEIELEDLEIDDFIIALGFIETDGLLLGKRVTVLSEEPEPAESREAVYGEVADVSQEEEVISLSHLIDETIYEIEIISKTIIQKKTGEKIEEIEFEEIEIGDRLAAVGTKGNDNGTITASVIYLIPSETEEVGEEEEVTPTPKATPTPEVEEEEE